MCVCGGEGGGGGGGRENDVAVKEYNVPSRAKNIHTFLLKLTIECQWITLVKLQGDMDLTL